MNILIYAHSTNLSCNILNCDLRELNPELGVEIHRSVYSLRARLSQPVKDLAAAIIYAAGDEELSELMSIQDLLWEVPLILLVPTHDRETVAHAHTLRPRFLTDMDGDFKEVADVLKRMLENNGARPSMEGNAQGQAIELERPAKAVWERPVSQSYSVRRNAATRRRIGD